MIRRLLIAAMSCALPAASLTLFAAAVSASPNPVAQHLQAAPSGGGQGTPGQEQPGGGQGGATNAPNNPGQPPTPGEKPQPNDPNSPPTNSPTTQPGQ
jgi:hypothetical protein